MIIFIPSNKQKVEIMEEAEAKVSDKANYLTTIEIEYWR